MGKKYFAKGLIGQSIEVTSLTDKLALNIAIYTIDELVEKLRLK